MGNHRSNIDDNEDPKCDNKERTLKSYTTPLDSNDSVRMNTWCSRGSYIK